MANIEIAPNNQFLAQRLRASGAYAEAERLEWGAEAILAGAVELANRASGLFWFNLRSVGVEPLAFYPPLWWFNMVCLRTS